MLQVFLYLYIAYTVMSLVMFSAIAVSVLTAQKGSMVDTQFGQTMVFLFGMCMLFQWLFGFDLPTIQTLQVI